MRTSGRVDPEHVQARSTVVGLDARTSVYLACLPSLSSLPRLWRVAQFVSSPTDGVDDEGTGRVLGTLIRSGTDASGNRAAKGT